MSEYYENPTIIGKIDEGDDDCYLWVITAGYKDQTVEVSDRDWMRGERLAIEAVKAKVAALEMTARTPNTDHDFPEVE